VSHLHHKVSALIDGELQGAARRRAIAHARSFLGTCGGLAWHAPFLGVPTVAVYEDDRLLTPHLLAARQAGERAGAADFAPLDLRALVLTGLLTAATAVPRLE